MLIQINVFGLNFIFFFRYPSYFGKLYMWEYRALSNMEGA